MIVVEVINKEGGMIIMVVGVCDGYGGEGFYYNLVDVDDFKEFLD